MAVAWMVLLFWASSAPDAQGGIWILELLDFLPFADKLVHAGIYGVLALFLLMATGTPWIAVMLASAYGVTDELHQVFVPGRTADPLDWLADTVGALVAVWLVDQFVRFLTQRRTSR